MAFQAKKKVKKHPKFQPPKVNSIKLKAAEEDPEGPPPEELIALHFRDIGYRCNVNNNFIDIYVNHRHPFKRISHSTSVEPCVTFQYTNGKVYWRIKGFIARTEVASVEDPQLLSKMEFLIEVYLRGATVLSRELKNKLI